MGGTKAVIAAVVLAIAGSTGYALYADKQKKEQQRAVAALLGDTTAQLRRALSAPPPADLVSRLDGNLKAVKAPRDQELADAAGVYIHGAREIVRRRGEAERLAREAAMSRRALVMHMGAASGRDSYWIRVASDLKKRVERDHHELEVSLKALSHLLQSLPETQKPLESHVDASLLLADAERRKAHERADETGKRAAQELEKVRRIGPSWR
ncbi:MAG TPA: hypothetical protein VGX52_05045 [Burkholderiales bacterium]|nr:hypothetical protein [Burkholderiales bacterium]